MANKPTIYIVSSDASRNGKTLLARLIVDYLLLDGKDPFVLDTDAPEGPLRHYFPGRTSLADFDKIAGRMKLFDTILASPGRDYVIDLPQRHMLAFYKAIAELDFLNAARKMGFRIIVFFVVDWVLPSLRAAQDVFEVPGIDLFVAVINESIGSSWPEEEGALKIPILPRKLAITIADRRFSLRNFVLGNDQGISAVDKPDLNRFLYTVLDSLNTLDVDVTLNQLKP